MFFALKIKRCLDSFLSWRYSFGIEVRFLTAFSKKNPRAYKKLPLGTTTQFTPSAGTPPWWHVVLKKSAVAHKKENVAHLLVKRKKHKVEHPNLPN